MPGFAGTPSAESAAQRPKGHTVEMITNEIGSMREFS
jgi:hypothetical protein